MSYIFKSKFNIGELANIPSNLKKVLVAEPEEYLLSLYVYHLSGHDFYVKPCKSVDALHKDALDFAPHLLLLNAQFLGSAGATVKYVDRLRNYLPDLFVVTIGHGTQHEDLARFMSAGVNGHIDRKLSKPHDVATLAKTLLFNR